MWLLVALCWPQKSFFFIKSKFKMKEQSTACLIRYESHYFFFTSSRVSVFGGFFVCASIVKKSHRFSMLSLLLLTTRILFLLISIFMISFLTNLLFCSLMLHWSQDYDCLCSCASSCKLWLQLKTKTKKNKNGKIRKPSLYSFVSVRIILWLFLFSRLSSERRKKWRRRTTWFGRLALMIQQLGGFFNKLLS